MQRSMASMVGVPVISAQGVRMGEIRDAWVDPAEHRKLVHDEQQLVPLGTAGAVRVLVRGERAAQGVVLIHQQLRAQVRRAAH